MLQQIRSNPDPKASRLGDMPDKEELYSASRSRLKIKIAQSKKLKSRAIRELENVLKFSITFTQNHKSIPAIHSGPLLAGLFTYIDTGEAIISSAGYRINRS